ncbi:phage tail protein [Aquibacillus rhizosphaerae]|uniref:Phage tail tape measure protein n=1 Tax=Aquibacillus rhizosphaerae TaxID=3051431 RepID=A0ABT7LCC3_9BACI|nr:hypothetical protein [Aquibacillus sp. LR5S19]MDL4842840.1 hypothetical protein [Aquibacillus sp. LR5S19]
MADYSIDAELKASVGKYKKAIDAARKVTQKFKSESDSAEDTELDANIKPLKRNIKIARKQMEAFRASASKDVNVDVDVNNQEAKKKIGFLMAAKLALSKTVVIPVEARISKFQTAMGRIANTIRAFDTVAQNTFQGIGISISSTLVPIIASMVPAIMAVGNAIGVLSGGVAGLATSFAVAGSGAVAFGAVATSALGSVFETNKEVTAFQEQLANTSDAKERAKINEQIAQATKGLSKEQQKGLKSLQGFSKFWGKFAKQFEQPVMDIFIRSLDQLQGLIKQLEPVFDGAVKAVDVLSKSLGGAIQSDQFKKFTKFLGDTVEPAMITLGKAFGHTMMGVQNLMIAFGPLSEDMQDGFLNMMKRFSEWTAGLENSKGFQKFVDYVRTNIPIIRSIFGDTFKGIINLFASFGDNSSIIFTKLAEMMAKFRKWSETVKKSDGFQKFIEYVETNGPKVIALIGNIISFIINLGIALAPMGAALLGIINSFISWTNSMMESYPIIGKIIAIITVVAGVLIAIVPNIIAFVSAFSGVGGVIMKVIPWVVRIGGSLLRFAGGPIGLAIQAVILLGIIIYKNWDAIWKTTKKIFSVIGSFMSSSLNFWIDIFKTSTSTIKTVLKQVFSFIFNNVIKNYMDSALNHIKIVWQFIKNSFKNALAFVKALLTGDFQGMADAVSNQMTNIKDTVSDIWNNVMDFFSDIDLYDSGKAIIQSAIDGILAVKNKILGTVEDIVSNVRDFWPFSPAKTGPLSDIHRMDFGVISDSIKRAKKPIQRETERLAATTANSFNPNLSVKSSQITSSLKGLKRNSAAQVSSAVNADIKVNNKQPAYINLNLGGREYNTFVDDISTTQEREARLKSRFQ